MSLNKRDRFSFRWSKSELPDSDDINQQVLLLGITRFETTPVAKRLAASRSQTKRNTAEPSHISSDGIYQSIEQLNRSSRCFPLDRQKLKKPINTATAATQSIDQKSQRTHFDRLLNRFQSKRGQPNSGAAAQCNSVEQKAFSRWLHLKRNRQAKCTNEVDQRKSPHTSVIRKCSTKSNNIRKATKKPAKPSSNFSSCCVASSRNDSIAGNSLASSQPFIECGAAAEPTSSNDCLMHSHCKSNKHCNKNTDSNHNNNCSLFNNLNIMDRSVDSIGSCSLDVDAESTDFSDTSGSLNLCTPLSGKDFTREFTSRIHERCQFPNHQTQKLQQTKTILDPNSGKVSTILSQKAALNSPTSPAKKPSYLNLACCVNGYSNLTTYDSKFRQSINKSREVSPIRPITYALQYNRNGDNNYLSIPTPVPIHDSKHFSMDAIRTPDKRFYTQSQQKTIEMNGPSHDVTDNVNSNGCAKYYTRLTTTNGNANTSTALVREVNQEFESSSKSFIQQRVERLYGPAAVTQGLYSPRKSKAADENQESRPLHSVLVEKSQNAANTTFQSTKYVLEAQRNGHVNGANRHDDENINLDSLNEALPVLRHLRPEFRAQLPTLSPKRTIAISKLNSSLSTTQTYTNGTATNGKLNISTTILTKQVTNSNGVASPDESLNRSTLDVQIHKHQPVALTTSDTTKNGCLTSHKSHDIEIKDTQNRIASTTNGSIAYLDERCISTDTPQLIEQMSAQVNKQANCVIASPQKPVNVCQIATDAPATDTFNAVPETMDANGNHKTDQKKDAVYFLHAVQSERDRLLSMAVATENELEQLLQKGDVEEDILGHLRSAAGKARLLATKKFKQFEGLCDDSINQITRDMPPPTAADLQGFWEMVLLQVENVDSLYADLDKIRANDWKKLTPTKPKPAQGSRVMKRPIATKAGAASAAQSASGATKKSATAIAAAQKRDAQRKQLLEMRRKNKLAMSGDTTNGDVIIDPSNTPNNGENSHVLETDR